MIAPLVALVLAFQQPQSMLRQVVPQPTGQNGYEDYLQAVDAIGDRHLATVYETWSPTQYATMSGSGPEKQYQPSAEQLALAKHLSTMTLLEVRQEMAKRYEKTVAWMRQGSQKKTWQPRATIDRQTRFPEFGPINEVSRIAIGAAYVAYADGRNLEGTQTLLDTIQMAKGIDGTNTLSVLYAALIDANAVAALYRHFPSMGISEAISVEKMATQTIGEPLKVIDTLIREAKMRVDAFTKLVEDPDSAGKVEDPDPEYAKWLQSIKALSLGDRRAVIDACRAAMNQRLEPVLARLRGPESGWPGNGQPSGPPDSQTVDGDVNGVATYYVRLTVPNYARSGIWQAQTRTRFRLIGLYASVIRFKWDRGRLPTSLEEAVGAARTDDPLSGEKFVYEPQGLWDFKIYSKGTEATGPIDLAQGEMSAPDNGAPVPPRPTS